MPGKISGFDSSQPPQAGSSSGIGQRSAGVAAGAAAGAGAGPTPDVVQITDTANQLATAEQTLNSAPAIDQGRVASLSNAIDSGTYTVQPDRIADQLLQFERLLPEDPAQ